MEVAAHTHYTPSIYKAESTAHDVPLALIKRGRCPRCGMQTHKKSILRSDIPINHKFALTGRCLACKPLPLGGSLPTSVAPAAPAATSSEAAIHGESTSITTLAAPSSNNDFLPDGAGPTSSPSPPSNFTESENGPPAASQGNDIERDDEGRNELVDDPEPGAAASGADVQPPWWKHWVIGVSALLSIGTIATIIPYEFRGEVGEDSTLAAPSSNNDFLPDGADPTSSPSPPSDSTESENGPPAASQGNDIERGDEGRNEQADDPEPGAAASGADVHPPWWKHLVIGVSALVSLVSIGTIATILVIKTYEFRGEVGNDYSTVVHMAGVGFTPDVVFPDDAMAIDFWSVISSNDEVGIVINNLKQGDIVHVDSISGIASFDNSINKILAGFVAIASGILHDGASYYTNDEAEETNKAITQQTNAIVSELSKDIKDKRRDGYGQDPSSGHFGKNEGGVIMCMPTSNGALYAASENNLKSGSKSDGRLPRYFSDNIRRQNSWFPARKAGGILTQYVQQDGPLHVLAFDSSFRDNGGSYTFHIVITRTSEERNDDELLQMLKDQRLEVRI